MNRLFFIHESKGFEMSIRKSLTPILVTLVTLISAFIMFGLEANAATVNASSTAEIQQAINNATGATEIVLTRDMDLSTPINVPAGKDITLKGAVTITKKNTGIAVKIAEGGSLTWQDVKLDGNQLGTNYSSAIIDNAGKLTMNSGEIKNVKTDSGFVGIVKVRGTNASFTMNGGSIHNNKMSNQFIAVVKVTEGASFNMNGGDISNNTLTPDGSSGNNAAVTVEGIKGSSTMVMNGGTITGNSADFGGVLVGSFSTASTRDLNWSNSAYIFSTGKMTMNGGTISNNTANSLGGGIAVNGAGQLTMEGGTISGNKAPFGGGIGINDYLLSNDRGSYPESTWRRFFPTKVTINNGTITGNHAVLTGRKVNNDPYAENGVGGGIYVASQEVTINGANITNNTAGKQGGGVYVAALPYRLQMGKTMVTGNTATKLGGGMWLCPTGSAKTAITNGASFFDNTAGTGANNNDTTAAGDDVASISKNDPATQTLILSNNGLDNWLVHWYEDGKIDNSYLGASNGSDRYPNTVNPPVDRGTLNGITDNISLKSIMSDQGKAAARTSAKVVVTGNKAPRGGGIGSNGEVDFGTSPINYDKIKLEVTKKWETDNNDHVTSVTVGLFRVTKSVIDGVVLKDANGNPIDTTSWTASQLSEAKIKQLMESGSTDYQQIDQVVLNDANNWKHSFVDLIKFNMVNDAQDTNNPFIYVVREMDSNGNWVQNESKANFGTQTIKVAYEIVTEATGDSKQTISNNVAPEEMTIEVKKDWVGKKASEVKVQLYKNGAPLGTVVTLNAANNWTTRFENLLVKDAGAANNNEYKVLEVGESNGEITINGSTYKVTYGEIDQDGKTVITNAEKPKPNPKNPPKKVKRTPKTGDANHVVFFTILGIGALVSLGFVYGVKRKYM